MNRKNIITSVLVVLSSCYWAVGSQSEIKKVIKQVEKPRYIILERKLRLLDNLENRESIGEFIPSGTKLKVLEEEIVAKTKWYLTCYKNKTGWINDLVCQEIGLARNSCIEIVLPDDIKLEDTNAGAWIRAFKLYYLHPEDSYITEQMEFNMRELSTIELLLENIKDEDIYTSGWVVDDYSEDDKSLTRVWLVSDRNEKMKNKSIYPFVPRSILRNPKTEELVINEILRDGMKPQWTLRLEPPGLEWEYLLKEFGQELKPNRESECAVIITSIADKGAKLYLFGWGKYCTKMSLH